MNTKPKHKLLECGWGYDDDTGVTTRWMICQNLKTGLRILLIQGGDLGAYWAHGVAYALKSTDTRYLLATEEAEGFGPIDRELINWYPKVMMAFAEKHYDESRAQKGCGLLDI